MSDVNYLVVLEPNQAQLSRSDRRLLGGAFRMASFQNATVDLLILGEAADALASHARHLGVGRVLFARCEQAEAWLAENMAPWLAQLLTSYQVVLLAASSWGKDLLPRLGGLLAVQPITDVVEITSECLFKRPIYAGSALESLRSDQALKLLSLRTSNYPEAADSQAESAVVELAPPPIVGKTRVLASAPKNATRRDLNSASVVVSGGRGLQSSENFALIYQLADRLNAAVGASRAAVDAGFASNDQQVGQTGKVVAPDLYIAVGLSGAVQHQAGMRDSRVIVAINKDPDAPIFQLADYGLVGDLFEVLPKLIRAL